MKYEKKDYVNVKKPWYKHLGNMPANIDYPELTNYELVKSISEKKSNDYVYEFQGKKTKYSNFIKKIEKSQD